MWRHYVYIHRKSDNGEVFYVGKGTLRKRHNSQVCERAHSRDSRSAWWHRTVAKHGLVVEVVASLKTDADAQQFEIGLIKQYGRSRLVNLTEGGDGHSGIVYSAETLAKRSACAKGPRSQKWIDSIRVARKNGGNGGVVKRGDKLPEWWRERISRSVVGEKNHRFGKPSPRRRTVQDTATGTMYPSITHAATAHGLNLQSLHSMLTGFRPNRTSMRFAC